MNNVNLYSMANGLQRKDAEDFLLEHGSLFSKIRSVPEVIDIGSGDGFVTTNILRKYLPEQIQGIYGVDKCEDMVVFGNKTYKCSDIEFRYMNLEEELDKDLIGKFDLVTSFYCLHWVPDHESALQKMYDLLDDRGVTLFCYPMSHPVFDVYKILNKNPVWSDITYDAYKHISPLEKFPDPESECRRLMEKAGFRNIYVENRTKKFVYKGLKQFQDFYLSVNPFVKRLSPEAADEFKRFIMKTFETMPSIDIKYDELGNISTVTTTYKLLMAYGFK